MRQLDLTHKHHTHKTRSISYFQERGNSSWQVSDTLLAQAQPSSSRQEWNIVSRISRQIFPRGSYSGGRQVVNVSPNNAINSDVQKRRFAPLLHAGYGER